MQPDDPTELSKTKPAPGAPPASPWRQLVMSHADMRNFIAHVTIAGGFAIGNLAVGWATFEGMAAALE
jgi:hypothetical protein